MSRETKGYSLLLCRSTALKPYLGESMNSLQFSSLYSVRRASITPVIPLK